MSNLREAIFAAQDIESEQVPVKQWGVTLEVRGLDGRGRSRVLKHATDENGEVDLESLYPSLIIASSFDPTTGEKVFQEDDANNLLAKSGAALDEVVQAAMKLSGLTGAAVEEAKKDSSSTPNEDTSSN